MKQFFAKLVSSLAVFSIVFSSFAPTVSASDVMIGGVSGGGYYKDTVYPSFWSTDGATVTATISPVLNGESSFKSGDPVSGENTYILAVTPHNGQSTQNISFTLDYHAPQITISGATSNTTYDHDVTVNWSANDNAALSKVTAYVNGASFSDQFSGSMTVHSNGTYIISVVARDKAGNQTTQYLSFTINRTTGGNGDNGGSTTPTTNTITKTITRVAKAAAPASIVTPAEEEVVEASAGEITITRVENADVPAADINSCNRVRVIGTAPEGALVILYIDRDDSDIPVIGFVKAGYGDTFEFVTDAPLKAGQYTIYGKLAWEGGQTGPIVELKKFEVEKCYRLIIWLLIILVALIIALVLWLFRRRRDDEDEVREVEEYLKEADEDETPTRL